MNNDSLSFLIKSIPSQRAPSGPVEYVFLPWHDRCSPRRRCTTTSGREIALAMPRGTVLADGTLVYDNSELSIIVRASPEAVVVVKPSSMLEACIISHHLGNWHRNIQVCEDGIIVMEHDTPVLDWLNRTGISYILEERAYEPNVRGHSHQ